MRFRQLLILIVLLALGLLVNAQSSPNYSATRTALAQQTLVRQGTRFFTTPAEFQLTVTVQSQAATNTARAQVTPSTTPSFEAQTIITETVVTEIPLESEPFFGDSVLPVAFLFFAGVLVALGILGGIFFMMSRNDLRR